MKEIKERLAVMFVDICSSTRLFSRLGDTQALEMTTTIIQKLKTTRAVDKNHIRFILTAGVTVLLLFLLPAVYFGSALQPWKGFTTNMALHNSGVYVNHIGLRGIVLFEPSHLSLKRFIEANINNYTNDIVLSVDTIY